jgi:hypothetical protein
MITRFDVIVSRLVKEPATVDMLARDLWGAEWNWPLTYKGNIRNAICILRKEGYIIDMTRLYTLHRMPNSIRIAKVMEL